MDKTKIYSEDEFENGLVVYTLKEVASILTEKGYDAKKQIVGYLMSGDPGYISSHKKARNKIVEFDRDKILEVLVDELLK